MAADDHEIKKLGVFSFTLLIHILCINSSTGSNFIKYQLLRICHELYWLMESFAFVQGVVQNKFICLGQNAVTELDVCNHMHL